MTNCINCGAPLHGHVCEYCGTEYGHEQPSRPQTVLQANGEIRELYSTYTTAGGNGYIADLVRKLNADQFKVAQDLLMHGIVTANEARRFCSL